MSAGDVAGVRGLTAEGVVERLRDEPEGERRRVVRFVVRRADGGLIAVEMRGEGLRGVLNDGDSIAVSSLSRAPDGTYRPRELRNLTTGSRIEMWSPRLPQRLLRTIGVADVWKAIVAAGVGAAVGLIPAAFSDEKPQGGIAPPPSASAGPPPGLLVGAIVVLLLVVAAVLVRRRRVAASLWAPAAVGLALGLAAALLLA